jgi:hypothetical protein
METKIRIVIITGILFTSCAPEAAAQEPAVIDAPIETDTSQ